MTMLFGARSRENDNPQYCSQATPEFITFGIVPGLALRSVILAIRGRHLCWNGGHGTSAIVVHGVRQLLKGHDGVRYHRDIIRVHD